MSCPKKSDWTKAVYVQQRTSGSLWTTRATLGTCDDLWREVVLDAATCTGNKVFRIWAIDANGQSHYSNTVDLTEAEASAGYIKI